MLRVMRRAPTRVPALAPEPARAAALAPEPASAAALAPEPASASALAEPASGAALVADADTGIAADVGVVERLVLPFDLRSRSRFRARLVSGAEVGVVLERGQVLRGGDRLQSEDGRIIEVCAADEVVTTVSSPDAESLMRIAYHLGNRHVALQIGPGWLRYSHDHVLDDMVMGLGALINIGLAPFEPESGAYHGSGHGHAQGNGQSHLHSSGLGHSHGAGNAPAHSHEASEDRDVGSCAS